MATTREFVGGELDGQLIAVPDDQTTFHVEHFRLSRPMILASMTDDTPIGAHSLGVYHLGADGAFHWQGEV